MLSKLITHEAKRIGRFLLPVFGALLILTALTRVMEAVCLGWQGRAPLWLSDCLFIDRNPFLFDFLDCCLIWPSRFAFLSNVRARGLSFVFYPGYHFTANLVETFVRLCMDDCIIGCVFRLSLGVGFATL